MVDASKSVSFGEPDGVTEGDEFPNHAALNEVGLHRQKGRGISGTAKAGADSIVLSGGYADVDDGDVILYTGEGKREGDELVEDQSWDSPGNAGLVLTAALGKPVRVIQGLRIRGKRHRRARGGYRYRGLYYVADYWKTVGGSGIQICQFDLRKVVPGQVVPRVAASPQVDGGTDLEAQARRYIMRESLARDSSVVRRVKEMYDATCQICAYRLVVSTQGHAYSEAAHIQALGRPHDGPDEIENVLCLCPTCHVRFDRGILQISDEFRVYDALEGRFIATLQQREDHGIRLEYVRQHRFRWAPSTTQ